MEIYDGINANNIIFSSLSLLTVARPARTKNMALRCHEKGFTVLNAITYCTLAQNIMLIINIILYPSVLVRNRPHQFGC